MLILVYWQNRLFVCLFAFMACLFACSPTCLRDCMVFRLPTVCLHHRKFIFIFVVNLNDLRVSLFVSYLLVFCFLSGGGGGGFLA